MHRIPALHQQISELIATPSISSTSAALDMGNRACAEKLANWLNSLGFICEMLELPGNPDKVNLIATLGSGPGGLVLAGHLDTVPCSEADWSSDPFVLQEREERWYGLGVCDMKAFFALAVQAIAEMELGELTQPLILLGTADEESSMHGARALAASGRPQARYAVIGEPTGLKPVRMHKGILMERLCLSGTAAHASRPDLGHSAIEDMHRALQALYTLRQEWQSGTGHPEFAQPHTTLNVGEISGGDAPNRVAAGCCASLDIRLLPGQAPGDIRTTVHDAVGAALGDRADIQWQALFDGIPAFATDADAEIVKVAEKLTGYSAGAVDFATEAPYLTQLGMQTLVLGPGDIDQAHQPDEYLALDRVQPSIRAIQGLISHFCLKSI